MNARPMPAPGSVEVWLLGETAEPGAVALPPGEEVRAARMATAALGERTRRRRRFLRRVLAAYLGLAPEAVPLALDERGKPSLPGDADLHFSLSHSADLSVLAVGRDALGIDVEQNRAFGEFPALLGQTCSPRERAAIAASCDPEAAFLDRAVLKEAILKCRGTGLVDNLRAVDPGRATREPWHWDGLDLSVLHLPASNRPIHSALAVAGRMTVVSVRSLADLVTGPSPAP